jgi:hypothetical protein
MGIGMGIRPSAPVTFLGFGRAAESAVVLERENMVPIHLASAGQLSCVADFDWRSSERASAAGRATPARERARIKAEARRRGDLIVVSPIYILKC